MSNQWHDWHTIFTSGTDYEADLVRSRLDDSGIPAVVLTQRDHAHSLTVGAMAQVHVLVPPDRVSDAEKLLSEPPVSGAELDQAALNADPHAPAAHSPVNQSRLDSGADHLGAGSDDQGQAR